MRIKNNRGHERDQIRVTSRLQAVPRKGLGALLQMLTLESCKCQGEPGNDGTIIKNHRQLPECYVIFSSCVDDERGKIIMGRGSGVHI